MGHEPDRIQDGPCSCSNLLCDKHPREVEEGNAEHCQDKPDTKSSIISQLKRRCLISLTLDMLRNHLNKGVNGVLKEASGTMGPVFGDVPVAEGNEKNGEGSESPGPFPCNSQQGVGIILHQDLRLKMIIFGNYSLWQPSLHRHPAQP